MNAVELRPALTLSGAHGQIASARFADDTTLLVACGAALHLLDATTGEARETVLDPAFVRRVEVSEDGSTFVMLDRSDRLSVRRRANFDSHDTIEEERRFSHLAIDAQAARAVCATENVGVVIDLARGAVLCSLVGHRAQIVQERGEEYDGARIWSVAVSAAGDIAVTGSSDQTAIVWDVARAAKRHVLAGHDGAVMRVAIDPGARSVATIDVIGDVRIWDAISGFALSWHRFEAAAVASLFDRAGQRLFVLLASGTLVVLARKSPEPARSATWWQPTRTYALTKPYPYSVDLSLDAREETLAIASPRNVAIGDGWLDDTAIGLLSLATGISRDVRAPATDVRALAAWDAPSGDAVAAPLARSLFWSFDDGSTQRLTSWPPLYDAARSPAGDRFAATGADGALGIYDLGGRLQATCASARPRAYAWNSSGDLLAASFADAGGGSDVVRVHASDGTERAHFGVAEHTRVLAFARDGSLVAGGSRGLVSYAFGTWKPQWRVTRDVGDCAFALRGGRCFIAYSDLPIAMYDLATGKALATFVDDRVNASLAARDDGAYFVTTGHGDARLWSVERERAIATFPDLLPAQTAVRATFTHDGSRVVFNVGNSREGGCATVFDVSDIAR